MNWRGFVLRLMRVPHEPEPPFGSPPRIFRAAQNYLTFTIVQFIATQVVLGFIPLVAFAFAAGVSANNPPRPVIVILQVLQVLAWAVYLVQLIVGWAVLRLNYELRWYMLSDRAIRIREGITTVREKTVALANVQNIQINQGPLQRLLGIADVEVKTAGGGSSAPAGGKGKHPGEPMHVAFFRGVDNAEEIRDLVREGVRRQKDSGLGDPDDHHDQSPAHDVSATDAVEELLREARKLRAVVEYKAR
jgi:uncharacterized membrane protein YdbT with pleckstrin-like domain